MTLKLYNTLTKKKEPFKPIHKGKVFMYSCGPTVYDYAHIGNFRAYVFQDSLRRYLEYKGYKVKQVMNLTDVDDKTIRGARAHNISLNEYTKKYIDAFFEDIETLNIKKADVYPRATETISEMVELVKKLLQNGIAYKGEDGSIYYNIKKFRNYGKLSGLKISELKAGARVKQDTYSKEQAQDFALWKAWDEQDGSAYWETPVGKGRPGWHIECSAMSSKHLGKTFDIHTGGVDLIFPHHENEIAQSEGATGKKFVNYWIHCEHLLVDGKKMSKSLGNFYTLRDLLAKGYEPWAIRYILLSNHYKQKLNFTFQELDAAKNTVQKIFYFIDRINDSKGGAVNILKLINTAKTNFEKEMDDNLNINSALVSIFEFMKKINQLIDSGKIGKRNKKEILEFMQKIDSVLGILEMREKSKVDLNKLETLVKNFGGKAKKKKLKSLIEELIKLRESARAEKNFEKSDAIRTELNRIGIILEDAPSGSQWKVR